MALAQPYIYITVYSALWLVVARLYTPCSGCHDVLFSSNLYILRRHLVTHNLIINVYSNMEIKNFYLSFSSFTKLFNPHVNII